MSSKLEIVNLALTMIGARRLTSLTAENETARVVATVYDSVLKALFEAVDWTFARHQQALALIAETDDDGVQPVQGYGYTYAIPNMSIKVRDVFADGQSHSSQQDRANKKNYEEVTDPTMGVTVIATDIEDAYAYFTVLKTDTGLYPPTFIRALAAGLAAELAIPLTEKESKAQAMEQKYFMRLSEAARINPSRENPRKVKSGGYIDARG